MTPLHFINAADYQEQFSEYPQFHDSYFVYTSSSVSVVPFVCRLRLTHYLLPLHFSDLHIQPRASPDKRRYLSQAQNETEYQNIIVRRWPIIARMASTQEENTVPETKVLAVASHVCLSYSSNVPMIPHDQNILTNVLIHVNRCPMGQSCSI